MPWTLSNTVWGRHCFAVGGNRTAAHAAGIPVSRHLVISFMLIGMLTALASILFVGRLGAAPPEAGTFLELNAIAAVVIGGASLYGGSGTVIGVLMGALLMQSLSNGLSLLNVPTAYQSIASGGVLILAVYVDVVAKRGGGYFYVDELFTNAWRGIALCAIATGYARQLGSAFLECTADRLFPTRNWTERSMGGVSIKVPQAWGEVEFEQTGPVVYNRPRRFRVDGDAVWYSTAIEIRVRHRDAPGLSHEAPMTEVTRSVPCDRELVLAAAMANGLSRQSRRTVDRILKSARPGGGSTNI